MRMMFVAGLALLVGTEVCFGQEAPNPSVQALGTMVQQCTGREAQVMVQLFAAQAQVKSLQDELAAEKKKSQEKGK